MNTFKSKFLLRDDVIFLNHGSFGACPKPVFEENIRFQMLMESQPVHFFTKILPEALKISRDFLTYYVGGSKGELVYVQNSTQGVNIVARSLKFNAGDEILSCDHEYGACIKTWDFMCRKTGAKFVQVPISLPVSSPEEIVEKIWSGVTSKTKLIFLSHITSATALRLPVEEICRRAREKGILTLIDGAHVPGHLSLNLADFDPDFYVGNCHKWLCSPKGAGFLYVRKNVVDLLEPLVVSWGFESDKGIKGGSGYPSGSKLVDDNEYWATRDYSAFLSVPGAIRFQKENNWEKVQSDCKKLVAETKRRVNELTGLPELYPSDYFFSLQMAVMQLPECDIMRVKSRLMDEFHIEVVVLRWNNIPLMRVSAQAYTTQADMDALIHALEIILPEETNK